MCAVVVFEVEKVIELFWSVVVECKKVVKTEKSDVTRRYTADSNSARRVQLIDMSEGGSTNRGCAFLSTPGGLCDLTHGLAVGVGGREGVR